jgi:hypothetical protein
MITLEQLATEEERLVEAVERVRGTMEQKTEQLARGGELDRYREVHRRYVQLALGDNVEALRRATFLQWIATIEPTPFTAIRELDASASHVVVSLLNTMCEGPIVDSELRWMLPYYTLLVEWWFAPAQAPALAEFCAKNTPDGAVVPPDDFVYEGRGQLGHYWASIRQGALRRRPR